MINLTRTLLAVVAISTATISPVKANVSFLEAALFFLTGVEATNQDIVTDREIILRRYPLVAYLVDGNPCAVRIRNTNNNRLYQMDFCKITGWRWVNTGSNASGYRWFGKDAFCISRNWRKDENYADPDFAKIASSCGLEQRTLGGSGSAYPDGSAYLDRLDIDFYFTEVWLWHRVRARDRMIASFRYIVWLLEGEEPKPY